MHAFQRSKDVMACHAISPHPSSDFLLNLWTDELSYQVRNLRYREISID
jgi:hypothetical protein